MESMTVNKKMWLGVLFFTILLDVDVNAQKKFASEKGEVSFTSNAKLELINASTKRVAGIDRPG